MYISVDADVYVDQSDGSGTNNADLIMGRYSDGDQVKILVHFPLTGLPSPSGTTLSSATLRLYAFDSLNVDSVPISIYSLQSSFTESAVWSGPSSGSLVFSGYSDAPGQNNWSITPYLQSAWQNSGSNFGLAIRPNFSGFSMNIMHMYRSSEASANKPQVYVVWTCP